HPPGHRPRLHGPAQRARDVERHARGADLAAGRFVSRGDAELTPTAMRSAFLAGLILTLIPLPAAAVSVPLDLTGVRPGPITITRAEDSATVSWPDETGRVWRAT